MSDAVTKSSSVGLTDPAVRTLVAGSIRDQVLTPDGKSVLVATTDGTVTRYDLANGTRTGSWQVGHSLGGMAVSADGRYLYATELQPVTMADLSGFSRSNVARLDRLDLQTGLITRYDKTLQEFTTAVFRDVAVTNTGDLLLSTAPAGTGLTSTYTFNTQTAVLTRTGNVAGYDAALAGTADGEHILVADIGISDAAVRLFTPGSGTTVSHGLYADNTSDQGTGGAVAISRNGSLVAQSVFHNGPDVLVYDGSLKLKTSLLQVAPAAVVGKGITGLAFSPDGTHLYVLNSDADQVFSLSTRTWAIEAVIAISPDTVNDVRTASLNGLGYSVSAFADRLLASADGRYLTVQGDEAVQVIDLTATTATPVLTNLTLPQTSTISPDGGNLFITVGATDATAKVQSVTLTLDHALATTGGNVTELRFDASHDSFDDTYSAVNLALAGSAAGTYKITSATIADDAGHSVTYGSAALNALLGRAAFSVIAQVDLTAGDDLYRDTRSIALTIRGLAGNDTIYAGGGNDVLNGGSGNDVLFQGTGEGTFIGGTGDDTVVLRGNARDYYLVREGLGASLLLARNGSATQFIGDDVEHVRFADGSLLATGNSPGGSDYSETGFIIGDYTLYAPDGYDALFNGGSGNNRVILPGNVADYQLDRVQSSSNPTQAGDFVLSKGAETVYTFDESVDTIQFANGQYLSLRDLPAYIAGTVALDEGGAQDDILYQARPGGYEVFTGAGGNDDLYLRGNVSDYLVRSFVGRSEPNGHATAGIELISKNGSGALFIDGTVETVHFQNGQYLAIADVKAYMTAAPASDATFHVIRSGTNSSRIFTVEGVANANDVLLLDGKAADYYLGRLYDGHFTLTSNTNVVQVGQTIDTVQFGDGQYLALHDLSGYMSGSAVLVRGSAGDDILVAAAGGDQYVYGAQGIDNLYLNGNTRDYTLRQAHVSASFDHPAIDGVQLVATNGSGTIYIDQSVESVHFQNGQYAAFSDLTHIFG